MRKAIRAGAMTLAVFGPALLPACSAPGQGTKAADIMGAPKPRFTLNTPVKRIVADPDGRAVLQRDVPGLMASKQYSLFDDMSLSEIAILSGGRLNKTKLALVQSDLGQLPPSAP